jgi:hypothetical protein
LLLLFEHNTVSKKYSAALNILSAQLKFVYFVSEGWHWIYSSAVDYFTDQKGLLDIILLDGF